MNRSEMRAYLTGKGFSFYDDKTRPFSTTIKLDGIGVGYLYDEEVLLWNDTVYKNSKLNSVEYTHPRCLERVDRMILYLKTADRRRERRMRRERAEQVKLYFNRRP